MICLLRHMGIESSVHGMRSAFCDYMGNETSFAVNPSSIASRTELVIALNWHTGSRTV